MFKLSWDCCRVDGRGKAQAMANLVEALLVVRVLCAVLVYELVFILRCLQTEDRAQHPLPVVHRGEPWSSLPSRIDGAHLETF